MGATRPKKPESARKFSRTRKSVTFSDFGTTWSLKPAKNPDGPQPPKTAKSFEQFRAPPAQPSQPPPKPRVSSTLPLFTKEKFRAPSLRFRRNWPATLKSRPNHAEFRALSSAPPPGPDSGPATRNGHKTPRKGPDLPKRQFAAQKRKSR